MKQKIKALLIGCGGIGSFLADELNRLILNDQIDLDEFDLTVADHDMVEAKNIRYQNFTKDDIFKQKAPTLANRYGFLPLNRKVRPADLVGHTLFIIAVDNAETRKHVFDYVKTHSGTAFIDLRAEGRAVATFTSEHPYDDLMKTLGSTPTNDKGGSCQLAYELEQGIIQNGNKIVAAIGSQLILNWLRHDRSPSEIRLRI